MSAEAAVQTATLLQNKVGSSLAGVTSLLSPEQKSDVMLQAGASSLPVVVLDEMKELQRQTYECVEKVANLLQTQIDIATEANRRQRDQAAELRKERKSEGAPMLPGSGQASADGLFGLTPESMKNLLTLGLGSVFTVAGLKAAFKTFGKKLLRGGIVASIITLVADPVVDFLDKELKLDLDDQSKTDLKNSLIGAGFGSMFGIPGAIVGATIPFVSRVGQYIAGTLNADQVKDSDFAAAGVGTTLASVYATGKLGKLMALSKLPAVSNLGMALASTPVLLAVGIGVAAGVGASFLAKKIDEYQEMTLKKLRGTVEKLDKEMGEWAAREEEGLFERFGVNLGQLSALGEAKVATQEAMEQLGQDKEKFMADKGMQSKLIALSETMAKYSDDAIRTILLDRTKAANMFDTLESLKGIAAKGGFGEDSGAIFKTLSMMSDRVQNYATKLVGEGVTGGMVEAAAENSAGKIRGQIQGGDQLENLPALLKEKRTN